MKKFCKNNHDLSIKGRNKEGKCIMCRAARAIEYYKRNRKKIHKRQRKFYHKNKIRLAKVAKEWRKTHKDIMHDRHLRYAYGISLEIYNSMLEKQNNKCSICLRKLKLNVDHDHETGKVRGLLCGPCNRKLEFFDNKTLYQRILRYLDA